MTRKRSRSQDKKGEPGLVSSDTAPQPALPAPTTPDDPPEGPPLADNDVRYGFWLLIAYVHGKVQAVGCRNSIIREATKRDIIMGAARNCADGCVEVTAVHWDRAVLVKFLDALQTIQGQGFYNHVTPQYLGPCPDSYELPLGFTNEG